MRITVTQDSNGNWFITNTDTAEIILTTRDYDQVHELINGDRKLTYESGHEWYAIRPSTTNSRNQ